MAGDWIKVQTCTPDKPEVHQMAEMLKIEPDAIVGKLIRIWAWADMHTIDGNAANVTRSLLDRITGVTGFTDALSSVGWLESIANGVHFTNFDRHNGDTAKTRALTGKRVAKSRSKGDPVTETKRECNGESVTESLPEKRREESLDVDTSLSVSKRFAKPTISQLDSYAIELAHPEFDAEAFIDHFDSNGWKVGGKAAMKDWKAAVRTWIKRNKQAKKSGVMHEKPKDRFPWMSIKDPEERRREAERIFLEIKDT
jgi:hypothetical protein